MKNRFLIFILSSLLIGIFFSFSMLCNASTPSTNNLTETQCALKQSVKQNGESRKKVNKEFIRTQKVSNYHKVKNNPSVNLQNNFNTPDYNFYFENKNLSHSTLIINHSSIEEIRTVRLII